MGLKKYRKNKSNMNLSWLYFKYFMIRSVEENFDFGTKFGRYPGKKNEETVAID